MSAYNKSEIETVLELTERAGLRLVLTVRSVLVAFVIVFIASTQGIVLGAFGISVAAVFLVIGLAYRWLVSRWLDRQWMRYAFVTLDLALVAFVAASVPLSTHGEVPQIFVFRVYGVGIFFFILATSALSLSPRLVLWTGVMAVAALWGAWGWIVAGMERTVTWAEISGDRTAENYIRIVLDPDMISVSNRVIETVLLVCTAAVTAGAVARARRLLQEQISAEKARGRLTEVFGRFVPTEVAERLDATGGDLPPDTHEATVIFIDIEGFTPFAERAGPEKIVSVLDAWFDTVSEEVTAERGVVISFIGDAAMAAFNAPLEHADHAGAAIRAARRLLARAGSGTFDGEALAIRIGIATGPVSAGTVGGRGRRAYTLYGDTVNIAQRLETMNKDLGSRLIVADETWEAADRPEGFEAHGSVAVRGRAARQVVRVARDALPGQR